MGCVSGLGAPPGAGLGLRNEASVSAMMEVDPREAAGAHLLLMSWMDSSYSQGHTAHASPSPQLLSPPPPRGTAFFFLSKCTVPERQLMLCHHFLVV